MEFFGDWRDVTEEDRRIADMRAHPVCEGCGDRGCHQDICPVYACCGLPALVTVDGLSFHAGDCEAEARESELQEQWPAWARAVVAALAGAAS
jgi:hypothetical protein